MDNVALEYLTPLQQLQLKTCRPDLFHMMTCQRPGCGGSVLSSYGERNCINCGAEHDSRGNWLEGKVASSVSRVLPGGFRR